jgi:hypothetical protein
MGDNITPVPLSSIYSLGVGLESKGGGVLPCPPSVQLCGRGQEIESTNDKITLILRPKLNVPRTLSP